MPKAPLFFSSSSLQAQNDDSYDYEESKKHLNDSFEKKSAVLFEGGKFLEICSQYLSPILSIFNQFKLCVLPSRQKIGLFTLVHQMRCKNQVNNCLLVVQGCVRINQQISRKSPIFDRKFIFDGQFSNRFRNVTTSEKKIFSLYWSNSSTKESKKWKIPRIQKSS